MFRFLLINVLKLLLCVHFNNNTEMAKHCTYSKVVMFTDSGKYINGDARNSKKNSVTDSIHSKTRFSDIEDDDDR